MEASFSHLYGTLSPGREKIVQDASLTYQQLRNSRDNLSSWLEQLPHHRVQPSDGPSQISYKLQAQKVRRWGCRGEHYL
jgi:envoplakin